MGLTRASSWAVLRPTPPRNAPSGARLTVDVVGDEAALDALAREWRALERRAAHPNVFAGHAWLATWWRHFRTAPGWGRMTLHVLAVRDGRRLRAVVPLVLRRIAKTHGLVRKLEFLGGDDMVAYLGWLAERGDARAILAAAAGHLAATRHEWDLIELAHLPADMAGAMAAALERAGLVVHREAAEDTRSFAIGAGWEQRLDRSWRRFVARKTRRLAELVAPEPPVHFVTDAAEVEATFDELLRLERAKVVDGAPGEPLLGARPAFFRELLARLAPTGQLVLALVRDGRRIVSFELAFVVGRELWAFTAAYDRDYAAHSPGTVVMAHVVDHASRLGCTTYDFLRGVEAYKDRWNVVVRHTATLRVRGGRARSRVASAVYFGGRRVARALRRG